MAFAQAPLRPSLAANMTSPASALRSSHAWSRSKESPMDWNFTEPRGVGAGPSSSSSLFVGENRKRSHEETAHGAPQAPFSFHAPLSPAIPGPEVEMGSQTPPQPSREHGQAEAQAKRDLGQEGQESTAESGPQAKGRKAKGAAGIARQTNGARRAGKARQRDDGYEHNLALAKDAQERFNVHNYYLGSHGTSSQAAGGHPASSSTPKLMEFDPEWCLGMAQFLFNSSLLAGLLWIGFQIAQTIRRDVADKVTEYEMELVSEIARCSQSYSLNRCGTELAAPALASACAAWERCAAKDPSVVGRARVTAETFAEILNGFVDAVSWKTMIFSLATLMIVVGATNSTLSFFRIKSRQSHQLQPPHPSHMTGHAAVGYAGAATHPFPQAYAHAQHQPYGFGPSAGIPMRSHEAAQGAERKPSIFSWRRSSPTSTPARKRVCSDVVKSFDEELDALR